MKAALNSIREHRLFQGRAPVDLFILANFAFLAVDIVIAHSVNSFAEPVEWIPLILSIIASAILAFTIAGRLRDKPLRSAPMLETVIAALAILTGIAGLFFHLHGTFFQEMTLKNLVYTAPFVAPLSYTGLGFLMLVNRLEKADSPEWSAWVVFLALGGFTGNFILSVCDHAQNGFFNVFEWLPVIAAALAMGFLGTLLFRPATEDLIRRCLQIMLLQIFTGLLGFAMHLASLIMRFGTDFFPNFIYGAPVFAPLLFTNLGLLALIGLLKMPRTLSPELSESV